VQANQSLPKYEFIHFHWPKSSEVRDGPSKTDG
jgi:hypothetical protein